MGKCTLLNEGEDCRRCKHTCPDCGECVLRVHINFFAMYTFSYHTILSDMIIYEGMTMFAGTKEFLNEVISAHEKKFAVFGKSQCEKKIAGLI